VIAARLGRFTRRRPLRLRLTLIYSGLFLGAGAVLLAVTYGLVAANLGASKPAVSSGPQTGGMSPQLKKMCDEGIGLTPGQVQKCQQASQSYNRGLKAGAADQRAQVLNHLLAYSLVTLALLVAISALLGWIVAGRALRPVHAVTAAARRASQENLSERIALSGADDELKELADTFDAMLARLEAAFTSQRRFVANASHELRTPLTVMRTAIDVTLAKPGRTPDQLEDMAAEVRQAAEHAEALIEALLTLARSDQGAGPAEALDLAVMAEDALDAAAPAARACSLGVETALEPAPAYGDPVLLERLVFNLIDNATKHNVTGGWIRVATGSRVGAAFVEVANGGPVIPTDLVESLFEPFRRLDDRISADGGAGLGLSIVQSVAATHGGHVTTRSLADGGLEVSVLLPARHVPYHGEIPAAWERSPLCRKQAS
jgi:signal transduction histidine kinase